MEPQSTPHLTRLCKFLDGRGTAGAAHVITDLDGTALHERDGRVWIPASIERAIRRVHEGGGSVVVNTLRFPGSVIAVLAPEWNRITGAPLPLVSLKGSQVGHLVKSADGTFGFEEAAAFPLEHEEIEEVMEGVAGMVDDGVDDLLVFHYPRDWREGELVWTPRAERIGHVQDKYRSASRVFSSPVRTLTEALLGRDICMIFLLVEVPQDRLMAYQHTHGASFFTHIGVDKAHGTRAMARHLGIALERAIGAGDAEPDNFLNEVGLAVIVGHAELEYRGVHETLRVADASALGELLCAAADAAAERAAPRKAPRPLRRAHEPRRGAVRRGGRATGLCDNGR
jgi:hydroxymethylpyrimidine pyrophosphatase-like HAD family hydrolase